MHSVRKMLNVYITYCHFFLIKKLRIKKECCYFFKKKLDTQCVILISYLMKKKIEIKRGIRRVLKMNGYSNI